MTPQQIKRAFEQADQIVGMDPDEHELEFAKYYTGLVLAFLTATQRDDIALQQAMADGWVGADNLGRVER